ncbi:MAG: undecaprenyl-diphosphatase UppP [Candidatus Doudnabacteria bacterium]|nr:undecaprenyl-diphosphatase UppP [Candidatus Doudnabacteria bacterium]
MEIFQAAILGLVQGFAEFLPISSSAHLVIAPWLFGWRDPGLGFDLALHWGTLLAVLAYFRKDILNLIKGFWHSLWPSTRNIRENIWQKLSWLLVIASIPGAIIGKLLEEQAETVFRNPLLIAITLSVFGVVLLLVDRYSKKQKDLDHITWVDSLIVGLSQAFAIIPGVSRSGSTMTAGLALGFKREDTARFSFLMSLPIIFGAGLLKVGELGDGVSTSALVAGFITAAVSGFLSIKFLLKYLATHDFKIFVWYRFIFAAVIIAVYVMRS